MIYLLTLMLLVGCVGDQTVTLPNHEIYTASIDNDTLVEIHKPDGTKVLFDRRGAPGMLENLLTFMGLKLVDTPAVK